MVLQGAMNRDGLQTALDLKAPGGMGARRLVSGIDYVPGSEGGEPGCVLEVFNALEESIAVVVVRESEIEGLMPARF